VALDHPDDIREVLLVPIGVVEDHHDGDSGAVGEEEDADTGSGCPLQDSAPLDYFVCLCSYGFLEYYDCALGNPMENTVACRENFVLQLLDRLHRWSESHWDGNGSTTCWGAWSTVDSPVLLQEQYRRMKVPVLREGFLPLLHCDDSSCFHHCPLVSRLSVAASSISRGDAPLLPRASWPRVVGHHHQHHRCFPSSYEA
jgi:hypothetical protein